MSRALAATFTSIVVLGSATTVHGGKRQIWFVPDQGHTTIQQAIDDNAVAPGDMLLLAPGDHPGFNFNGKGVHIRAIHPDPAMTTISPGTGQEGSIVVADSGESLNAILEGVTIRDGVLVDNPDDDNDPDFGAAVRIVGSSPGLVNCVLEFNEAPMGGAVYISGGSPIFQGCVFRSNTATSLSGLIAESRGGAVLVVDHAGPFFSACSFIDNTATATVDLSTSVAVTVTVEGGAVHVTESSPFFTDCTFDGNLCYAASSGAVSPLADRHSFARGGALAFTIASKGSGQVISSTFSSNVARAFAEDGESMAQASGGAVYTREGANPQFTLCDFSTNRVHSVQGDVRNAIGGAVYAENSSPGFDECDFDANICSGVHVDAGAGVTTALGSISTFQECTFTNHSTARDGGAMHNSGSSVNVFGCDFTDNVGAERGGAVMNIGGAPEFEGCAFTGNGAEASSANSAGGGGMWNSEGSDYTLSACMFLDNVATAGGAILNYANLLLETPDDVGRIEFCTFMNNVATGTGDWSGGGAMKNFKSSPIVVESSFKSCQSAHSGGAVLNRGRGTDKIGSFPDFLNCIFQDNTAADCGGGMFNTENLAFPLIGGCEFTGNSASQGGAIYNDPDSEYVGSAIVGTTLFCANTPILTTQEEADDLGQIVGFWYDNGNNLFAADCPESIGCMADTNFDGHINVDDLINVIIDFGSAGTANNGDVNGDSIVDVDDLVWVILVWGPCPEA